MTFHCHNRGLCEETTCTRECRKEEKEGRNPKRLHDVVPKLGHKMQIRRIRLNDFDYLKRNSNNKNNNNKNSNKSNNKQKKRGGKNPVKRRERVSERERKSLKIQINKAFLYFRRRCIQLRPSPFQLPGLNNDDDVVPQHGDDDDDDYFGVLLCLCLLHLQWKCRAASSASTLHAKCILNVSLANAGAGHASLLLLLTLCLPTPCLKVVDNLATKDENK